MSEFSNIVLITIFISFPQVILMLKIGFSLCGIILRPQKILIISAYQGVVVLIVQLLNIPFDWHTVVQVITLWLLVSVFLHTKAYKAAVPVLVGTFIDSVVQGIFFPVVNLFHTLHFQRLGHDFIYTIKWVLPVFIVYIMILRIIKKKKLIICQIKINQEFTKT